MTDVILHYAALMQDAEADLDDAGERWLEARAAGQDCHKEAVAIREAETAYRKYERKIKRLTKKRKRRTHPHD